MLEESLEEDTLALVGHIHGYIIQSSGLLPLLQALDDWDPKVYARFSFTLHKILTLANR